MKPILKEIGKWEDFKEILFSPQMLISITILLSTSMLLVITNVISQKKQDQKPRVQSNCSEKVACDDKVANFPRLDSAVDIAQPVLDTLVSELQTNGPSGLSDTEVLTLVDHGKIPSYSLEKTLDDYERAVRIRRILICNSF